MIQQKIKDKIEELSLKFLIKAASIFNRFGIVDFIKNSGIIIVLLLFCAIPIFSIENDFTEKVIVEDFEKSDYTEKNLKTQSKEYALPRLSISSLIVAPIVGSKRSLYLQFPDYIQAPVEFSFNQPYYVKDYAEEIILNIYSSKFNGKVYIMIHNFANEIKQFPVGQLNYSGWREFHFIVRNILNQNDILLTSPKTFAIKGLVFEQGTFVPGRENIVAIDDILLVQRKKILINPDLKKLMN